MAKSRNVESKDPGLGARYDTKTQRIINDDGSFNVRRTGVEGSWRSLYHYLIELPWWRFMLAIFGGFFALNVVFALLYMLVGVENLHGEVELTVAPDFFKAFFFSVQTCTTVGYGHIAPVGFGANIVATIEATVGLMVFALITGLLYGRFSKPSAKILYSKKALIAPFEGMKSLHFRIVNKRSNILMDMEASVLLVLTEKNEGGYFRRFYRLELETDQIHFFPLSWTVVHAFREDSPFYGLTMEDLIEKQAELLVLLKGFDESFGQIVRSRHSYTAEDMLWGAKFKRSFRSGHDGIIESDVSMVHECERAELPD